MAYRFRARLIPSLVTAILLPIFIALALWQLDRADFKYELRKLRQENSQKAETDLFSSDRDAQQMLNRKVRVNGRYLPDRTLLLVNRKYRGQPGYLLYTPMRLGDGVATVLIARGWLRQSDGQLPPWPQPAPLSGTIHGRVDVIPSVGIQLGEPDEGYRQWPKVVSYLTHDWLQGVLDGEVLPYVVKLRSDVDDGLIRDWPAFSQGQERMPPEKHTSYAVQWFALTITLALLYLMLNLKKSDSEDDEQDE